MEALRQNYIKLISPKSAKKLILVTFLVFLFDFAFFSLPVWAAENGIIVGNKEISDPAQIVSVLKSADSENMQYLSNPSDMYLVSENDGAVIDDHELNISDNKEMSTNTPKKHIDRTYIVSDTKPKVETITPKVRTVKKAGYVSLTAYNSEAGQTDNSPCTTANGFNVCKHGVEDTIAANFLKFGSRVKIPALFGDRVFVVRDRMNARYGNRIDVWMKQKSDAIKFGVRFAKVEVVE